MTQKDSKMVTLEKKHINLSIATAIIIVLFIIAQTANIATWKTEMQAEHKGFDNRIDQLDAKMVELKAEVLVLDNKADKRDLQIVEIQTKLINIEALLIEIKEDLKIHSN